MDHHYKQLFKGVAFMSVVGVLRKGVGFLLLPVYTRYLTPEDYGAVSLFLVAGRNNNGQSLSPPADTAVGVDASAGIGSFFPV